MKAPRLARRRSHLRRLKSGRPVIVGEHWIVLDHGVTERRGSYRHPCPKCRTEIISVRMPNGGWVHFEGQAKLSRIKHPCMHIGEGLGRRTDDLTQDLFDKEEGYAWIQRHRW